MAVENTSNLLLPLGQAREASWFSVRTVLLGMEISDAPDRTAPLAAAGLWCRGRSGAPAPRPGRGRGHKECALMMPGPARRGQKLSREIPSPGFRGPHGMGFFHFKDFLHFSFKTTSPVKFYVLSISIYI